MRTLHVDLGREMRGGQFQCLSLVEALGRDAMLMARRESPLYREAQRRGIHVVPAGLRALRTVLARVELAHAHDAQAHQWLALVANKPFVVSRRVAFKIKRNPLSAWKYGRAAHYLAVSEFVAGELRNAGVAQSKITVVYDGVEMPDVVSAGGSVLSVRSADPQKGTALVEEACRIAGVQVQWASKLLKDLETASIFVYVSASEGLGSAALHAMAAGVPVVASRVGGLVEIVRDEETGVLTANDPEAIAAAIRKALASRDTIGALARKFVADNFTREHMVARTLEVYRKVLG